VLRVTRRVLAIHAQSGRSTSRAATRPPLQPIGVARQRDFLLARISAAGDLVDLTEPDVRFYLFWVGLEFVLHR
jgi:hypothetical protein